MVSPATGAVVLIPFPFSDLSRAKLRPALVLADSGRGDWILAQITSKPYGDPAAIQLSDDDFLSGSLARVSYVKPTKLFTLNEELMRAQIGRLKTATFQTVAQAIIGLFTKSLESHEAGERSSET